MYKMKKKIKKYLIKLNKEDANDNVQFMSNMMKLDCNYIEQETKC